METRERIFAKLLTSKFYVTLNKRSRNRNCAKTELRSSEQYRTMTNSGCNRYLQP